MKKFVCMMIVIAMMAMVSAIAEIEPYGGYEDVDFYDFVYNSEITDPVFYGGTAYQEVWLDNGWHISAECTAEDENDIDEVEEAIMHVYDDSGWIVGTYTIKHNDEGEQMFWDIMYVIYNGELSY